VAPRTCVTPPTTRGPFGWLLGSFALAHLRVYNDPVLAASSSATASHLNAHGLGTAVIFDGDPPLHPAGASRRRGRVAKVLRRVDAHQVRKITLIVHVQILGRFLAPEWLGKMVTEIDDSEGPFNTANALGVSCTRPSRES